MFQAQDRRVTQRCTFSPQGGVSSSGQRSNTEMYFFPQGGVSSSGERSNTEMYFFSTGWCFKLRTRGTTIYSTSCAPLLTNLSTPNFIWVSGASVVCPLLLPVWVSGASVVCPLLLPKFHLGEWSISGVSLVATQISSG